MKTKMKTLKKRITKDINREYKITYLMSFCSLDGATAEERNTGTEFELSRREIGEAMVDYIEKNFIK